MGFKIPTNIDYSNDEISLPTNAANKGFVELFLSIVDKLCVLHCVNLHFLRVRISRTRIHRKGTVLKSDTAKINQWKKIIRANGLQCPGKEPVQPTLLKWMNKIRRMQSWVKGQGNQRSDWVMWNLNTPFLSIGPKICNSESEIYIIAKLTPNTRDPIDE